MPASSHPPGAHAARVSLDRALDALRGLRPLVLAASGAEALPPALAVGRVVARALTSPRDLPRTAKSRVDGYALGPGAGEYRVVGEAYADGPAEGAPARLGAGDAIYVATGAPLPEGAVAVVPVEECEVRDGALRCPPPGGLSHVRAAGSEVRRGQPLLERGEAVSPAAASLLEAVGVEGVMVHRRPRVSVLPTGDELVSGRVPATNATMAAGYLRLWGCVPGVLRPVGDQPMGIAEAMRLALPGCDAVIMSGGTAVGARDFAARVLSGEGAEPVWSGVQVCPGGHSKLAVVSGKPVLALPGRLAAFLAAMHLLARPLLAASAPGELLALPPPGRPPLHEALVHFVRLEGRPGGLPQCVEPPSALLAQAYLLQPAGEALPSPCRAVLLG